MWKIMTSLYQKIMENNMEIYNKNDEVDPCYGLEELHLTKNDIEALKESKMLYTTINDGEYAITIEMESN